MMGRAERGGGSSGSSSRPGVGEETPAFSTRVAVKDYRPQIGRCLLLALDVSLTVAPLGNRLGNRWMNRAGHYLFSVTSGCPPPPPPCSPRPPPPPLLPLPMH